MKFLALVSSLMVSSAAFATPALDEAFYTVQAPTITQVSPVGPPLRLNNNLSGDLSGVSTAIAVGDQLVAFGQKLWSIIENNRPVVNLTNFTPVSVLPLSLGLNSSNDLDSWKGPAGAAYRVEFKNLYNMTVVSFTYTVHFQYAGKFNEKGAYITGLSVTASNVEVLSGFNVEAKSEVMAISNQGSRENPVASATIQVGYRVRSVLKDITLTDVFHVTGEGKVLKY